MNVQGLGMRPGMSVETVQCSLSSWLVSTVHSDFRPSKLVVSHQPLSELQYDIEKWAGLGNEASIRNFICR